MAQNMILRILMGEQNCRLKADSAECFIPRVLATGSDSNGLRSSHG